MILMIDNYDSFTYNLVQLLSDLGAEVKVVRNDEVTAEEAMAMGPAGIVVSPGPGTPDDAGVSSDVIRSAAEAGVPVLGVCLGHQCIASVYGGRIVRGPEPVHGKTAEVSHSGEDLLEGVPDPFTATRYHKLAIVRQCRKWRRFLTNNGASTTGHTSRTVLVGIGLESVTLIQRIIVVGFRQWDPPMR